jgi:hypothetical protein
MGKFQCTIDPRNFPIAWIFPVTDGPGCAARVSGGWLVLRGVGAVLVLGQEALELGGQLVGGGHGLAVG